MGTFAWTTGKLTVPDDKKDELRSRVYDIFCKGGLCAFEEVALYGKKLYLLTPPEMKENGDFLVWHSYFEDDSWEAAGFNTESCCVWSNKLGWKDFNTVLFAAYILEEQYSTTPFFADIDGRKRDFEVYGGWLNYLFNEKYTMESRNFWNLYLALRQDNIDNNRPNDKITYEKIADNTIGSDINSILAVLCADNKDFVFNDKIETRDPEHELSQNVYDLYHCLIAYNIDSKGKSEQSQIETLLAVMCGKIDEVSKDCATPIQKMLEDIAALMKKFIPHIVISTICYVYGRDFWDLWGMLGDAETICLPFVEKREPVKQVTTQEFLTHETRCYLYFWRENNGISLDGLEDWFAELKVRFDRLMSDDEFASETGDGIRMMRSMIETLDKANEHYGCIFAFREMFYDFLEHCSERRYQAWWKIFCDLVEENWDEDKVNEEKIKQGKSYVLFDSKYLPNKEEPARAEIKGYLGLMANKDLREKVFDA